MSNSDVWLHREGYPPTWLEVKTDHRNNLSNPRMYYDGEWKSTYGMPSAKQAIHILNTSRQAKEFIRTLALHAETTPEELKLATNKAKTKHLPGYVDRDTMNEYFEVLGDQYIATESFFDIGSLVTQDMLFRNVHYLQAADDFYHVGHLNPLNLTKDIPLFEGEGDFRIRVAISSTRYEIQAELKVDHLQESAYSCLPNTDKINPFL